jgi:hypothetical protein
MRRIILAAALGLATTATAGATDMQTFYVRNAADLVALCSASPDAPNYIAAIHFCQGFGVGAYQYYLRTAATSAADRFVCPPDPPPSRDDAIAGFVAWANARPDVLAGDAVDALFLYLHATYPCPAHQAASPERRDKR